MWRRLFWSPSADDKEAQPLLEKEDTSPLVVFCFVVNSCIGVPADSTAALAISWRSPTVPNG